MAISDLFDNRLWETYEVNAVPKRGGTVERRRYIGKNPMTMEFTGVDYGGNSDATVAASTPTNEKESSIFGGLFAPKDVLGISPFSGPFESGEQYVGSDNVYRKGSMSYDVADPSRHHARFNPGGHTTTLRPVGTSEWGLGTLYNDAGETQARRLAAKPDLTGIKPKPEDAGIIDTISGKFTDAKDWASESLAPAWEKVGRGWEIANQRPEPTTWSEQAQEAIADGQPVTPSREIGTADLMMLNGILDNISNPAVRSATAEEFAVPRARFLELVEGGMDRSTAAIIAARESGYPTGKTRDERRAESEAKRIEAIKYLKETGVIKTAPNGTEYVTIG